MLPAYRWPLTYTALSTITAASVTRSAAERRAGRRPGPVGHPVPILVLRQLPLAGAVGVDDEELVVVLLVSNSGKEKLLAVRRPTGVDFLRGRPRDTALVLAVGVGDVELGRVTGAVVEQAGAVPVPVTDERDPLAAG